MAIVPSPSTGSPCETREMVPSLPTHSEGSRRGPQVGQCGDTGGWALGHTVPVKYGLDLSNRKERAGTERCLHPPTGLPISQSSLLHPQRVPQNPVQGNLKTRVTVTEFSVCGEPRDTLWCGCHLRPFHRRRSRGPEKQRAWPEVTELGRGGGRV